MELKEEIFERFYARLPVSLMFIYLSILYVYSRNSDFEDRILKLVYYECNKFKISKYETKIIYY